MSRKAAAAAFDPFAEVPSTPKVAKKTQLKYVCLSANSNSLIRTPIIEHENTLKHPYKPRRAVSDDVESVAWKKCGLLPFAHLHTLGNVSVF